MKLTKKNAHGNARFFLHVFKKRLIKFREDRR